MNSLKKRHASTFQLYVVALISVLLFVSDNLPAQTQTVNFLYDVNGNRVKRWIPELKIIIADSTDSLSQDSLAITNVVNSVKTNKVITLYPNPTQALLDLKIIGMKDGETAEYVFTSITGQELLRRVTATPITRIDISTFTPGIYVVNVKIGKRVETWKIVKQP
jgi:hypothetical protein